jgi:general secretion pathway protein I
MSRGIARASASRGFTLIEVLVALVIVGFGMGALLAALSASASNIAALREKTLAQWVALNQIADARLNLQAPQTGTTQGDLKNFANGDWHWQQDVIALTQIPGLLQITVNVRRLTADSPSTKSSSTTNKSGTSNADTVNWLATIVGFRGTTLAPANGETPDWTGTAFNSASSSSSGATMGTSSSGSIANPGTSPPTTTPPTATTPLGSSSSSGGN